MLLLVHSFKPRLLTLYESVSVSDSDSLVMSSNSLCSGHVLRICVSAQCIRTATASPLSPTAGHVREREHLCFGDLSSLV